MQGHPLQKARKLVRFFRLSKDEADYCARLKDSTHFNATFYRDTHLQNPISRRYPERHYALFGEALGLMPNPGFQPKYYLTSNTDVASANMRPLDHYMRTGHKEGRVTLPQADVVLSAPDVQVPVIRTGPAEADFAVVLHLYYYDLWEELAARLADQDIRFDLFVTLTDRGESTDDMVVRILERFPKARIFRYPNHGRDIFPFMHLNNSGALQSYQAVAKIHGKKSPHREDGDSWRTHLVGGILPGDGTADLLHRFLQDRDSAIWVADGQIYSGNRWWGSNRDAAAKLLRRVELRLTDRELRFPAGSIYWIKPHLLSMLRALDLTREDFTNEACQVDGTTAHAVERSIGVIADAGSYRMSQTTDLLTVRHLEAKRPGFVSAFYLPQFHPIPENDDWWGKGFTEWQGVTRAKPNFEGHRQPFLPSDLSFYDLRQTKVMGDQYQLAKEAGIDAFCVYHYWFDGHRLLETPMDGLLNRPEIPFNFYLCWANESWRRNWDGLSGEVLMPQSYAQGFEGALARSALPYMTDPRYARPDGTRPRFVIYRPGDMPDADASIARLRDAWHDLGVGEVELGAVLFHGEERKRAGYEGFDFLIEMPPHGSVGDDAYLVGGKAEPGALGAGLAPGFKGLVYNYDAVIAAGLKAPEGFASEQVIPGLMPSWDNTARRGTSAHIAYGANPSRFRHWLKHCIAERVPQAYRQEVFLNAWNEWGEKAVLEPSHQYGHAYLDVLREQVAVEDQVEETGQDRAIV